MLVVRYVDRPGLHGDRAPRLLRYLLAKGADEFTITVLALQDTPGPFADAFEDELGPYELRGAERVVLTAADSSKSTRFVRLWSFDATSLERLLTFMDDGPFHSPPGPDGWLEDLTIYRRGELLFGVVSHEQESVLRLTSDEHRELEALGIPSRETSESVRY